MARRFPVTFSGGPLYEAADNPLALWLLDGDLLDSSGNAHTLVDQGGTSAFTDASGLSVYPIEHPAPSRQAWDNTNARLEVAASPLRIAGANAVSMQAWIRPDTVAGTQYVVSCGHINGTVEAENFLWSMQLSGTGLRYLHEHSTGVDDIATSATGFVSAGQWQHIAIVRAANGLDLTFYVNGVPFDTASLSNVATGGGSSDISVGDVFGAAEFNGQLAGIQIEDSAVPATKIYENYRRGRFGF